MSTENENLESTKEIIPKPSGIIKMGDDFNRDVQVKVIKETKVYIWIRLHLKSTENDVEIGDDVEIVWNPSGERLKTKFVYWGKKISFRNSEDENDVTQSKEDDYSILTLMIDEGELYKRNDINFIRTLFKVSKYFQYQTFKKSDLLFVNLRTNAHIEYISCDF